MGVRQGAGIIHRGDARNLDGWERGQVKAPEGCRVHNADMAQHRWFEAACTADGQEAVALGSWPIPSMCQRCGKLVTQGRRRLGLSILAKAAAKLEDLALCEGAQMLTSRTWRKSWVSILLRKLREAARRVRRVSYAA